MKSSFYHAVYLELGKGCEIQIILDIPLISKEADYFKHQLSRNDVAPSKHKKENCSASLSSK